LNPCIIYLRALPEGNIAIKVLLRYYNNIILRSACKKRN